MIQLALSSGTSCILAYGQTGSGKTYTMEGLETRIARDLFVAADHLAEQLSDHGHVHHDYVPTSARDDASASTVHDAGVVGKGAEAKESEKAKTKVTHLDVFEFSVTFLELLGKRAVDLLEPSEGLAVDESGNPVRKEVLIHEDKVCFSWLLIVF